MSKSKNMTEDQLKSLGLEEFEPGKFRPIKKNETTESTSGSAETKSTKRKRKVKSRQYVIGDIHCQSDELISFTVIGEPPHQERHRHRTIGKGEKAFVSTYDPSANEKKKFLKAIEGLVPKEPWDCPIKMVVKVYCSRPKYHYGTGRNEGKLKDNAPLWKTTKPDSDNHQKFFKDSMNKVFFTDDSNVCHSEIYKFYSIGVPYTHIELSKIIQST